MRKQWQLRNPDPRTVQTLGQQLACSPLLARLLAIRGVQSKAEADRFLNPSLHTLAPPWVLAGMDAAVQRIHAALIAHEKILVYGDYDADGITATAVLTAFLRQCGAHVSYHIPHRAIDGYGLGVDFIKKRARRNGVNLIITVDCGSSDHEAIRLARQAGIHTIVTDHHPVAQVPPDALAVINPTRPDCPAGLSHLAGVGVAFYLTIALRTHLRSQRFWQNRSEPNLSRLCDLVALGTIADVAPLVDENRVLTAAGLQQINHGARPGLAALMHASLKAARPADAQAIAFSLAPRLNAAGRLAHARMACELLLTDNDQKAAHLAAALCRLNVRRQSMENALLDSILQQLPRPPDRMNRAVLVVEGRQWHEGLLGIVAARLTRRFNRPTAVISTRNGLSKGSARSIDGIDIAAALKACTGLLDRCGGHPLAAGFSLPAAQVAAFKTRLEQVVGQMAPHHDADPIVMMDAAVPLDDITPELMNHIERLAPFGQGNPYPLFMDTGIRVRQCTILGQRHRRMLLEGPCGGGRQHPAIQFNVSGDLSPGDQFEKIAYRPQWNYWNGRKQLQLVVENTHPVA